jgi:hypothetical protein
MRGRLVAALSTTDLEILCSRVAEEVRGSKAARAVP